MRLKKVLSLAACILLLTSVFSYSALALDEPAAEAEEVPAESGQSVEPQESSDVDSGNSESSESSGVESGNLESSESSDIKSDNLESSEALGEGEPAPYVPGLAVAAESPLKAEGFFEPGLYTGTAAYSYILEVPPGTAGLAPGISLSYSSQAARGQAGPAGLGWSLTESYILRDVNYTPDDTSDDEFDLVLNGQKFDLVFSEEIYGGTTVYKTKVDSFMQIYSEVTPYPCVNDYCLKWIVRAKDGTTYTFGSVYYSELESTNRDFVVRWNLDTISDTHGNRVYFEYLEEDGASYLSNVTYNFDRQRLVEFVWEARPDNYTLFSGGTRTTHSKRLKEVLVKADENMVRKYVLNYTLNDAGTKSLLASIRECGSDGTTCLPETAFTYYAPSSGWVNMSNWSVPTTLGVDARVLDVNGDGLADILRAVGESGELHYSSAWLNNGSGWVQNPAYAPPVFFYNGGGNPPASGVLGDVNGDGLPDLIPTMNGSEYYLMNNGTGWANLSGPVVPTNLYEKWGVVVFDVNGDGFDDIVEAVRQCLSSYGCSNFVDRKTVWINDGGEWVENSSWALPEDFFFIRYGSNWSNDPGSLPLDVNGDGLTDLVQQGNIFPNGVWLNNGSGWELDEEITFPTLLDSNSYSRLADVNGDGLVDVLKAWECTLYGSTQVYGDAWLNNGSGWNNSSEWSPPTGFFEDCDYDHRGFKSVKLADVNGDGFSDIIRKDYDREDGLVWFNVNYGSPAVDALMTLENSLGGRVNLTYVSSTAFDNTGSDGLPDLGLPVMVVSSVTEDNGMTGAHNVQGNYYYDYSDGLYDFEDREFRGFGHVTEVNPANRLTLHWFHQNDSHKGKEYETEFRDTYGYYYLRTYSNWSANGSDVYELRLNDVVEYTYDGYSSNPKTRKTTYQYDAYGNVVKTSYLGDINEEGDEKYAYTEYLYNTDSWIVNKPKHTYLHGADDSTKLSETWLIYDDLSYGSPPVKGDVTSRKRLLGSVNVTEAFEYDGYGNVNQSWDAEGRTTVYGYDSTYTFPVFVRNNLSQYTNYSYDLGTGNLLSVTDPNGYETSYEYDELNRVKKEIRPYDSSELPTVNYTYYLDGVAPSGVLVRTREESGQSGTLDTYSFVDGMGRVIQSRTEAEDGGEQVIVNTFYDSKGRLESQSVPHFDGSSGNYSTPNESVRNVSQSYDALDRITSIINTDGSSRNISYYRWVVNATDENGNLIVYTEDAFGRITKVEEKNGGDSYYTFYGYNARDDLVSITDSLNNTFSFEYDTLGRKVRMLDPYLGNWTYAYDDVGNLVEQTDGMGTTIEFDYDSLDRVTRKDYPNDTDVFYAYDDGVIGTLSEVNTTDAARIRYGYDERLRLTGEVMDYDGFSFTRNLSYDAMDRVVNLTLPSGEVVTYTYNGQGLLESLSGVIDDFDYNAFGKQVRVEYGNDKVRTLSYFSDDFRLSHIEMDDTQGLYYTYDDVGNVLSITGSGGESFTQYFGYDDLNRLVSANESGNFNFTYEYNSIGNILRVNDSGVYTTYNYGSDAGPYVLTSFSSCVGDSPPDGSTWNVNSNTACGYSTVRLGTGDLFVNSSQTLSFSSPSLIGLSGGVEVRGALELNGSAIDFNMPQALAYDENGNLVRDDEFYYEYNNANQLARVNRSSSVVVEYCYDHSGRRLKKIEYPTSGGNITIYYIGNEFETKVYSNGTEENTTYYYANGELVGRRDDGGKYYYHNDHLGGTHVVTNSSGGVVERTRYKPFGDVLTGGESEHGFTGHRRDKKTNLILTDVRPYDPILMRWIQPDPIVQDYLNPQHLNRYSYTANNPLKYTDPTGNYLETAVDVVSLGWSIRDLRQDPYNKWNWIALAADVGTLALPLAAGGGTGVRAFKASEKVDDIYDMAKTSDALQYFFKHVDEVTDASKTTASTTKAIHRATQATRVIDNKKITNYLLEPSGSKSRGFELMGYSKDAPNTLKQDLLSQASNVENAIITETKYGTKYTISSVLEGPSGVKGEITSVWQIDKGSDKLRLVTAWAKPFTNVKK